MTSTRFRLPIVQLRWGIGAALLILAGCMLVSFFTASWITTPENGKVTAWELWTGEHNGTKLTLSMREGVKPGFGGVRGIDRFVIVIPSGALILGALGVNYAFRRFWDVSSRTTALAILITAAILFIFPYFWQLFSTGDWRATLKDYGLTGKYLNNLLNAFKAQYTYSTGEQALWGLIALLVGFVAVVLEAPQTRAYVNPPSNFF